MHEHYYSVRGDVDSQNMAISIFNTISVNESFTEEVGHVGPNYREKECRPDESAGPAVGDSVSKDNEDNDEIDCDDHFENNRPHLPAEVFEHITNKVLEDDISCA